MLNIRLIWFYCIFFQGVGYPLDIVVCSALGADMYDCVYPTRTARFGTALVPEVMGFFLPTLLRFEGLKALFLFPFLIKANMH